MMEPAATLEQPVKENDVPNVSPYPEARISSPITPQAGCPSCGAQGGATDPNPNGARTISYVYAIGKVEARFPNLAAGNSPRRPAAQKLPGKPTNTPSTPFCPSVRIATWFVNCAGC